VLMGVLRFNLPEAEVLYADLAPILDPQTRDLPTAEKAQRFVDALAAICRDCKVPASLAEVGVREADLTRLAEDAMKQTRLLVNNPREVTYQDAYAIYSEALDGRKRQAA
jgi:alcohol dehydrogenase class IV